MAMARMATSVWSIGPHKSQCRKSQRPMVRQRGFQKRSTSEQKKAEGCLNAGTERHFEDPTRTFNLKLHYLLLSPTKTWARGRSSTKNHTKKGALPLPSWKTIPRVKPNLSPYSWAGLGSRLHESIFMSTCLFRLGLPTVFFSKTKLGTSQRWMAWWLMTLPMGPMGGSEPVMEEVVPPTSSCESRVVSIEAQLSPYREIILEVTSSTYYRLHSK